MGIFGKFEAGGEWLGGVGCCFCGRPVEPGIIDPVTLTIEARWDRPRDDGIGVQTNWCHADCLEATGMTDLHVTHPEFWSDAEADDR